VINRIPWPQLPDLTARLVELHASPENWSCNDIAKLLSREFNVSVTRNAVIGKSHRMELPFRAPRVVVKKPRKRTKRQYSPRQKQIEAPQPRQPRTDGGTVTIYQLRSDDCRFPLGDFPFVFCGKEQQEGSSYCPEHFRICHGIVQRMEHAIQLKAWA